MKASFRAVRIAPKKAQLVAKMIRGKSVPDAMHSLERTNKKAARLLEQLLRSAMANASHNEKQDPQMLIVKTLIVNKAQAYHRGVPMARGRVRPMRKFMSHIHLTLGIAKEEELQDAKGQKAPKAASQTAKKPVKKKGAAAVAAATKSSMGKSSIKETASSDSTSNVSSRSGPESSSRTASSTKK